MSLNCFLNKYIFITSTFIFVSGLNGPTGIAFDNLYCCNYRISLNLSICSVVKIVGKST